MNNQAKNKQKNNINVKKKIKSFFKKKWLILYVF